MGELNTASEIVPQFESLVGQSGLHIYDPIEDIRAVLFTNTQIDPTKSTTSDFVFPVDSSTEITVQRLQTPNLIGVWVRDMEGNLIHAFDKDETETNFPHDDYLLEFSGLGIKIYTLVEASGIHVTLTEDSVTLDFSDETTIKVGARSMHNQPARKLTTTSKPSDLMRAISLFGNAMKTWSPERTFPTLRGHPPLLELDSTCQIPDDLEPPDTGIEISVPAEYSYLYPVSSLAYWLGATVQKGDPALIVGKEQYQLGRGDAYQEDSSRKAFENHVRDILQFTFLLDCAVRTEGFYEVDLDARRTVKESNISLDFEKLYESPIDERIQTYLELDHSFNELVLGIGRPGWRLTADVQPDPMRAPTMPFLARDLAIIRCPEGADLECSTENAANGLQDVFSRSSNYATGLTRGGGASIKTRSSFTHDPSNQPEDNGRIVGLPDTKSMSQAWIGDGFAIGAAKASTKSYLQRLEHHSKDRSGININVVVNDEEMADEASVSEIYGAREYLEFDIDLRENLSTEELAGVFESDTDFVHYIGHVDPEGFDCRDGYLEANQLGNVSADTFVLNACASYEQGQRLVDRGAIAGVVTLEDVINSLATKVGKTVARLLNYGFPIGSATELIQETIFTGSNYVVVGDSNASLTQSNVPVPTVARVALAENDGFNITLETYASWNFDVGTMIQPYLDSCNQHYIVPGELDTWHVTADTLDKYLDLSTIPVLGQGNLFWSDEVTASELKDKLEAYS